MRNIDLRPFPQASSFRRIAAVAWDPPRDPTIYGTLEVRAERLLSWIDLKRHETGERVTVTHAVVRALALSLARHPEMNALVRLWRLELRRDVDIFAQVLVESADGARKADLSGVCIRQADQKGVARICQELRAGASAIRKDEDAAFRHTKSQATAVPGWLFGWMLRALQWLQFALNLHIPALGAPRDPFGSAMVTSMGMMGIRQGYAPFFPLSRSPLLILVGAVEDRPVVEDGALAVGKVLTLNGTFDHRVIDGLHASILSREIQRLLENPRLLDEGEGQALGAPEPTEGLPTLELDPGTADRDSETAESPTQAVEPPGRGRV